MPGVEMVIDAAVLTAVGKALNRARVRGQEEAGWVGVLG